MQLSVWTYEGPPHIGTLRVAASMEGVHCVLHAPQGDTYADLLFTMIERRASRPPVTYTTFKARDLGGDTAELVKETIRGAQERFNPRLMLVGESCTAELIQDQAGALAKTLGLPSTVVPLELAAYSRQENWGASETFYQLLRHVLRDQVPAPGSPPRAPRRSGEAPRANLLGATTLGFRCRDDVTEMTRLLGSVGVEVNVVAPLGADPEAIARIPEADFNCCLYPEVALTACAWLERQFKQPTVRTVPIGVGATRDFLREIGALTGIDVEPAIAAAATRLPWYSRSVDSNYLTGKRVFIFGDGTHAVAAARIASQELGFQVVGLGTYAREMAREVRAAAALYGVEPLITNDYLEVEARVAELRPELVLGTQMERHIAKRQGIPCAVIAAPFHVQDCPARFSPQMGFEGANVIFDTWVHPLMMGLEEHLLTMFRGDFEFHDEAPASHLPHSGKDATAPQAPEADPDPTADAPGPALVWSLDAERELKRIPFFVRGKARRNTELYAMERDIRTIDLETLYDAKAHYGR
jgi:light-independent protochlorophyllide reductase subunit B